MPVNPLGVRPKRQQHEVVEPYADEMVRIRAVFAKLNKELNWQPISDDDFQKVSEMIQNEFGDIGFEVEVDWYDARTKNNTPILIGGRPMRTPQIVIVGRTDHKEYEVDHDRMQDDVVKGKIDGQAGYLREDGTKREDPIKSSIYLGKKHGRGDS